MVFVRCLLLFLLAMTIGVFGASKPVEINKAAIVRLVDERTGRFFCSGTVVSDKIIITAAHCVGDALLGFPVSTRSYISVRDANNKELAIATVHRFFLRTDQAMLTGDFSKLPKMELELSAEGAHDSLSSNLIACGYPYGERLVCAKITNATHYGFFLMATGYLFPGMSGGPVIDTATGKQIAINYAVQEQQVLLAPLVGILSILESTL